MALLIKNIKQLVHLTYYFPLDRNHLIYNCVFDPLTYLIDNHSDVKGTVNMNLWSEDGDSVVFTNFSCHYYVPITPDSGLLYCSTFLKNIFDYRLDTRIRMFSRPMFHVFSYKDGQLNPIRGLGTYPAIHRSKANTRYYYHFTSSMNKDTDLVAWIENDKNRDPYNYFLYFCDFKIRL